MGERVHFNCIRHLVYTYIFGLVSIILQAFSVHAYIFGSCFGLNSTHLNFKYQT